MDQVRDEVGEETVRSNGTLVRPAGGRFLGGVAAGLGDFVGVDPVVFRVAFVVLGFVGGVGIFLYLLAWLVVPTDGATSVPPGSRRDRVLRWLRGRPGWIGFLLTGIGTLLLAGQLGFWRPTVFWGVALIGFGILLFRHDRGLARSDVPAMADPGITMTTPGPIAVPPTAPNPYATTIPPPPHPVSDPEPPAETISGSPMASSGSTPPIAHVAPWRARFTSRPRPWPLRTRRAAPSPPPIPRERSALGWLTIGAILVAVGAVAALGGTDVLNPEPVHYVALVLTVLGVGLVAGTLWGRGRWLIVPGILILPLVLGASLIDVPFEGGFGQRYVTPDTRDGDGTFRLAGGSMTLDLRDLGFGREPRAITATVAVGDLVVFLPPQVTVLVKGHAGAGAVEIMGFTERGLDVDAERTDHVEGSRGKLLLDVGTGIGAVSVYRLEEAAPNE